MSLSPPLVVPASSHHRLSWTDAQVTLITSPALPVVSLQHKLMNFSSHAKLVMPLLSITLRTKFKPVQWLPRPCKPSPLCPVHPSPLARGFGASNLNTSFLSLKFILFAQMVPFLLSSCPPWTAWLTLPLSSSHSSVATSSRKPSMTSQL